jgi:hypothetical protein
MMAQCRWNEDGNRTIVEVGIKVRIIVVSVVSMLQLGSVLGLGPVLLGHWEDRLWSLHPTHMSWMQNPSGQAIVRLVGHSDGR